LHDRKGGAILKLMQVEIEPTTADQVADLRFLYARDLDDIILYEREIRRGQTRIYGIWTHGALVGYGILHGEGEDRSKVVEFFLLPQYRRHTVAVFDHFTRATGASGVLARTNDTELVLLLHERTCDLVPSHYCFRDAERTHHPVSGVTCRRITPDDLDLLAPIMTTSQGWPFELPDREALAAWIALNAGRVLEDEEGIVGIGAILEGYNPPFANIGMVVMKRARRCGYATCLIEELKRDTYELGKIPRADCAHWNTASRSTLLRAGFLVHARTVQGTFASPA
jgi:hypothetical protein